MYHSIDANPRDRHAVHPDLFAQQMQSLQQQGYRVVGLAAALARLRQWKLEINMVALTFDDAYEDFLANAVPILQQHRFAATVFAPTGLLGSTAIWDSYDKTKQLMDWSEMREVERLGYQVASHTVSHPRLTECDETMLERELRGSLDSLRANLRQPVPILSYPGGYFGRREMRAAQRYGYVGAVGVASRWRNFPWTNPYHLHRMKCVQ